MIRELGNVELFELCETTPKVQCSQCLFYWNQGVIYCSCGQFLFESESKRHFINLRLAALSIPHYVIKKRRCHGARHGKTEEQKEYHVAWNAWKRCCKRVNSQGEHVKGIHDRFLRDGVYRESQLLIGWTEQKCIEMDELAKQDHTYRLSKEEFKRHHGHDQIIELQSRSKTVFIENQVRKLQNQYLHSNTGDGTLPQAIPGGTRPKIGGAHDIFEEATSSFLLQLSLTVDGDPL